MDIVDRLLSRIKVNAAGCFEWQRSRNKAGYGKVTFNGRQQLAHRVSFAVFRNADIDSLFVCHHCDNPCCINPSHLFLGTCKDNMDDAKIKGRLSSGSRVLSSKMREEEVMAAVRLYESGETSGQIASRFGVSASSIYGIISGKKWTSVTGRHRRSLPSPRVRMTPEAVRDVRSMVASGVPTRVAGRKYGINSGMVSKICLRQIWKNITD